MSLCLNHTDRPATNKCKACWKPICDECFVDTPDGTYCSQKCVDNTSKFQERMATLGPLRPPPGALEFLRGPVLVVVGIAFAFVLVWCAKPWTAPAPVGAWIRQNIYHEKPSPSPSASAASKAGKKHKGHHS